MDKKFSTESWMAESFFRAGSLVRSAFCSGVSMSAERMAKSWTAKSLKHGCIHSPNGAGQKQKLCKQA
jgi:hypothetical protein